MKEPFQFSIFITLITQGSQQPAAGPIPKTIPNFIESWNIKGIETLAAVIFPDMVNRLLIDLRDHIERAFKLIIINDKP